MNFKQLRSLMPKVKYEVELGLQRMNLLMKALGNPQKHVKFIHVAGTNGKGSTATFLSNILTESGYRTGLYTSPSLVTFNERIRVNRKEIRDEDIVSILKKINKALNGLNIYPTEFEIYTAIAFQYFYEQYCDIVILEVGLGGRLDATNIIKNPLVTVITPISMDHMGVLGSTLTEIAMEKAGTIKRSCPVVLYPQTDEVEKIIREKAFELDSPLYQPNFSTIETVSINMERQRFQYKTFENLEINLLARYQLKNAAMAIETIEILKNEGFLIFDHQIRRGLTKTQWPCRFEIVHKHPAIVLDGSHNLEGFESLVKNLKYYFPYKRIIGIVGLLKDKDCDNMLKEISPLLNECLTVTPQSSRAISAEDLAVYFQENHQVHALPCRTYKDAAAIAFKKSGKKDVICAFGSLYFVGEIRSTFIELSGMSM